MPPTLDPTFVLPLPVSPDGSISDVNMMFAGSPPKLFIAQPVWNESWATWLGWHTPNAAVLILLVAVVLSLWLMTRIWRRPRLLSRMYCRVCNHQLARPQLELNARGRAVWAGSDAKCPECGQRHKKGPVRGRSRFVRMLPVILIFPVVGLACGLTILATLGFAGTSKGRMAWPITDLQNLFGNWTPVRNLPPMLFQSIRMLRVDPQTGEKIDLGPVDSSAFFLERFVTPNGRLIVMPVGLGRALLLIDTENRERRIVAPAGSGNSFGRLDVLRYSADSKIAYVEQEFDTGGERTAELLSLDLATGKFSLIGSVSFRQPIQDGTSYATSRFHLHDGADGVRWVYVTSRRFTSKMGEDLVIRWNVDGKPLMQSPASPSGMSLVGFSEDGKHFVIRDSQSDAEKAIELSTGANVSNISMGTKELMGESGPRNLFFTQRGIAHVQSLKDPSSTVAQLVASPSTWRLRESADGNFAAGIGERLVPRASLAKLLGLPDLAAANVLIWDFGKLLDAETGEPIISGAGGPVGAGQSKGP